MERIGISQANQKYINSTSAKKIKNTVANQNLKPLQQDTVEISGKKSKKALKALAFLGISALGVVALLKHGNSIKTHQYVQDIFLEDFSPEDALKIKKKYKDILKIKNKDELIDKAVKELKKDYKINDLDIRIDKTFDKTIKTNSEIQAAATHAFDSKIGAEVIKIDPKHSNNKELLKDLTHELRHAKQNKFKYQVASDEEFIRTQILHDKEVAKEIFTKSIKPEECTPEEAKELIDELIKEKTSNKLLKQYEYYHNLGISKIDKNDRNYEWGRKILKSFETFANASKETYKNTFYEIDAKEAHEKMMRLIAC